MRWLYKEKSGGWAERISGSPGRSVAKESPMNNAGHVHSLRLLALHIAGQRQPGALRVFARPDGQRYHREHTQVEQHDGQNAQEILVSTLQAWTPLSHKSIISIVRGVHASVKSIPFFTYMKKSLTLCAEYDMLAKLSQIVQGNLREISQCFPV